MHSAASLSQRSEAQRRATEGMAGWRVRRSLRDSACRRLRCCCPRRVFSVPSSFLVLFSTDVLRVVRRTDGMAAAQQASRGEAALCFSPASIDCSHFPPLTPPPLATHATHATLTHQLYSNTIRTLHVNIAHHGSSKQTQTLDQGSHTSSSHSSSQYRQRHRFAALPFRSAGRERGCTLCVHALSPFRADVGANVRCCSDSMDLCGCVPCVMLCMLLIRCCIRCAHCSLVLLFSHSRQGPSHCNAVVSRQTTAAS